MVKMGELVRVVVAGFILAVLASCATTYQDHGYVPTDGELAQIKVGDSREAVSKLIGPPSITGLLDKGDWYYVQSRWRTYGAMSPKEEKREVVAVSFTTSGRVQNIERFGLERGHVVALSRRVTTSTVKSLGLLQQLFSDIGTANPAGLFSGGSGVKR